jgi:DNA polymerase I-like protein with 3'-5' exonuclease and polymerase domains
MDLTAIKHFRSDRLRGGVCFTAVCNSFFQGLASDLFKAALFRISRECYDPTVRVAGGPSPLLGSRIVHEIHDEVIVEAPDGVAAECAERVRFLMCDESKNWIPDVPAKAEPVLSRVWSKKAKAVYDAAGRLTVWEPPQEKVQAQ